MSLPPTAELEDFLLELNQHAQRNEGSVSANLAERLREYADQVGNAWEWVVKASEIGSENALVHLAFGHCF